MNVSCVPALHGNDQPLHKVILVPWENLQLLKCCRTQEEYLHIFGNPLLKVLPEVPSNHLLLPENKKWKTKVQWQLYICCRKTQTSFPLNFRKLQEILRAQICINVCQKWSENLLEYSPSQTFLRTFQSTRNTCFPSNLRWLFLKRTGVTPVLLLPHFEEFIWELLRKSSGKFQEKYLLKKSFYKDFVLY